MLVTHSGRRTLLGSLGATVGQQLIALQAEAIELGCQPEVSAAWRSSRSRDPGMAFKP